jgi:predicted RNase H-like nuclease
MSQQAYAIIPKIREVDALLRSSADARSRVREVHPEVCFREWNDGRPLMANKKKTEGKVEREVLIEARWPGVHESFLGRWLRRQVGRDDLNDAFAALWTAGRIAAGVAVRLPSAEPPRDALGLPMEMWA